MKNKLFQLKNFNAADWLSFYRIISAPILILFILLDEKIIFAWFLLISLITDLLDGFIARTWKIKSTRGSQLDTIGDLITFILGIAGIFRFEKSFLWEYYKLISLALVPYFISLLYSTIRYGKPSSFHTYLAKAAAILQGTFLLTLFFWGFNYLLFLFTIIISVLVSIEEIILIFILPEWKVNVKGLYWVMKEKKRIISHE